MPTHLATACTASYHIHTAEEVTHTTEGTMGNAALAAQLSSIMGDEALYGELSRRGYFKGRAEEVKAHLESILAKDAKGTETSSTASGPPSPEGKVTGELTEAEIEDLETFVSEGTAIMAEKILGDGHFIRRLVVEQGSVAEKVLVKLTELKESLSHMTSKDAKSLHRAVVKAEELYLKAVEEAGYRFEGGKFVGSEEEEEKEGPATVKKSRKAIAYENAPANSDIISMVAKVKSGEFKDNEPVNLGMVSDEIAEQIQKITGINVHGYKMVIEARQIKHILKDHGEKGRANQSMADPQDIAKMEYALENPDTIVNAGKTRAYFYMRDGYNRTADTVRYEKNIGDENYYVIQAVPETNAKTLFVVSAYIGTQEHNKKASQLANVHGDDHAPDVTSEIDAANASDNRIAQKSEFVKRDFSEGKVKESRKPKSQTSVDLDNPPDELTGTQRQIVAEHSRPKVYTKAEALSVIDDIVKILEEVYNEEGGIGEASGFVALKKKTTEAATATLWKGFNKDMTSKERVAFANKLAEPQTALNCGTRHPFWRLLT